MITREERLKKRRLEYHKNKEKNKELCRTYHQRNREKVLERKKARYYENLEKNREASRNRTRAVRLKYKYDMTQDEWDALFEKQGKACAICNKTDVSKGSGRGWHTDHCHINGHVRGILCKWCNHMLGHAKDNPETLRKAALYLETNQN